jgi:steroid delta-isomerase-like uncharacterized protein
LDEGFNRGNFAAIEKLVAPDASCHYLGWGIPSNRMGFKQLIAILRTAFPDLHCTVEDEIIQGDKIATHWTMRGTHQGLFLGNPPTGKPIVVQALAFACIKNGQVVDNWTMIDQMGVLQQLGLIPPPR